MSKDASKRRRGRETGLVTLAAAIGVLSLAGCEAPNNLWVNIISSGTLTATNVLISALANNAAQDLFGTTGSAGDVVDMGGGEEEEGDHGH